MCSGSASDGLEVLRVFWIRVSGALGASRLCARGARMRGGHGDVHVRRTVRAADRNVRAGPLLNLLDVRAAFPKEPGDVLRWEQEGRRRIAASIEERHVGERRSRTFVELGAWSDARSAA